VHITIQYMYNCIIKWVITLNIIARFCTGVNVTLTSSSLSVNESNSGTTVNLCVSLDSAPGPIDRDIEVTLNTATGTAG